MKANDEYHIQSVCRASSSTQQSMQIALTSLESMSTISLRKYRSFCNKRPMGIDLTIDG
jgi:hypothetical protein